MDFSVGEGRRRDRPLYVAASKETKTATSIAQTALGMTRNFNIDFTVAEGCGINRPKYEKVNMAKRKRKG